MTGIPAGAPALNPFPWYARKREESPVYFDVRQAVWHIFGYDDVQRVLSESATFSSERGRGAGSDPLGSSIISLDPPRHRQLRSLVTQAFTPRSVARLEPRIEAITRELLDAALARDSGAMEIIGDLATPLPVTVIAEMLGIPSEDRARFKLWSDAIVQGRYSAAGQAATATLGANWYPQMVSYFLAMIEQRRQEPRDDLISGLIAARVEGEHLNAQELLGFCLLLLIAGNETTTNLIGNAILAFEEHPEALERLRQSPELLPSAIEEALRYRSPVQSMFRVTTREVELSGRTIPADAWLVAWIGSANRDPAQFPDPDSFDIARTPNRHLAFGHGIHFCIGAPLARLEARIALGALLERTRDLRIAPHAQLEAVGGNIVFGVQSLPVTFTPA